MPSSSNNVVTAGRTYLDLITSTPAKPQNALPARPKTKRERADENWKILVSRHRPACARSLLAPCDSTARMGVFGDRARRKRALCLQRWSRSVRLLRCRERALLFAHGAGRGRQRVPPALGAACTCARFQRCGTAGPPARAPALTRSGCLLLAVSQDGIIKESEQFPKGSEQRAKCLERLHEVLRRISKRPKGMPAKPQMFDSAADEWEDFLAPTCSMCGLATDNNACKCDELAKNAEAFLAPEDAGSSSASSDTTLQDGDQDDVFPQKMSP